MFISRNFEIKKAALRAAFIFLSFGPFAFGQAAEKNVSEVKTETYTDIIEKAQNLALQKDRPQAINILTAAIKKEGRKTRAPKELFTTLDEISTVFFSEKAQQSYELALSLISTDKNLANTKLTEALRQEVDNLLILEEQARLASHTDCSQGLAQFKRIIEINPYYEPALLGRAQTQICTQDFEAYLQSKPTANELRQSELLPYWHEIEIEYFYQQKNYKKAKEAIAHLIKVLPKYPEIKYWQWKIESEQKIKNDKLIVEYLNHCNSLSKRDERKYRYSLKVCKNTSEAEAQIKKTTNGGM
jgi:hypothetical protein